MRFTLAESERQGARSQDVEAGLELLAQDQKVGPQTYTQLSGGNHLAALSSGLTLSTPLPTPAAPAAWTWVTQTALAPPPPSPPPSPCPAPPRVRPWVTTASQQLNCVTERNVPWVPLPRLGA